MTPQVVFGTQVLAAFGKGTDVYHLFIAGMIDLPLRISEGSVIEKIFVMLYELDGINL